jgi:DNA-binding beta-propeller fold protein YncE
MCFAGEVRRGTRLLFPSSGARLTLRVVPGDNLRKISCLVVLLLSAATLTPVLAQTRNEPPQIPLPTSKFLTAPSPGRLGALNGFAAAIALSPDKHYAAILNDGYGTQQNGAHQSIAILDLSTNHLTDFPEERLPENARQSYFLGLAFSSDGSHLYASIGSITDPTGEKPGNTGNGIAVYNIHKGAVAWERFIKIAPQKIAPGKKVAYGLRKTAEGTVIPYPAGLTVIAGKGGPDRLLVANNYSDNAVLLDTATGRVLKALDLSTHEMIPSSFPYTCVASRDGRRAWCSLWNASRVAELDLEKGTVVRWIPLLEPKDATSPGSHPTALLLSPDEKMLYVALSNVDKIAVISTEAGRIGCLLDAQIPAQRVPGGYPIALTQSQARNRLFAADASLNAVAVFDTTELVKRGPEVVVVYSGPPPPPDLALLPPLGFIPTDWYPSALATVGDDLLIATAKGQGTGPNSGVNQLQSAHRHREHPYIATLLYGSIDRFNYRDIEPQLPALTRQVQRENRFDDDPGQIKFARGSSPIHHVIYVIKENRTYDQVLGDLKLGDQKIGNGDQSLTLYGADVTPNEHKLALQFGVLDNFYDSGEVSGDGHDWSTAAITSDYNEKTWQIAYRGKERTYDYQGTVADEIPLERGDPDIDAPVTGYIWDNVASHGLSYRDYGEFLGAVWCKPSGAKGSAYEDSPAQGGACPRLIVNKGEPLPPNVGQPHGSASPWPWAVPLLKFIKPTKAVLRDHFDPLFPEFDTEYPDQLRADEFLNEFDGFVQARKQGKGTELPAFVLLYLPNDHTHGTTPGKPRPAASVADNDLAVGRVVEAVSHSLYWDDTAILILEDDAQDGADHVDAHRSIAFVISKYSPGSGEHPFVDSRFYATVNMIHSIEMLLGLPPMNQNDGYATVMASLFSGEGMQPPFTADWSNRDNGLIYQMNPDRAKSAEESENMDFSRPDANNPSVLNGILWRDRKGDAPLPVPRHAVFANKAEASGD